MTPELCSIFYCGHLYMLMFRFHKLPLAFANILSRKSIVMDIYSNKSMLVSSQNGAQIVNGDADTAPTSVKHTNLNYKFPKHSYKIC